MGEKENRIIEYLFQPSSVIGFIAVASVIWKVKFPEVTVEAILSLAAIALSFFLFLKDRPRSVAEIGKWLLQDTTLKAIVISVCVIFNHWMPAGTLAAIMTVGVGLLGIIGIITDDNTKMLVGVKPPE